MLSCRLSGLPCLQSALPVKLPPDFWSWSLVERRAWFNKEVMVNYVPQEILPGDLIAGARFNLQTSRCWNKDEVARRDKMVLGKKGSRAKMKWFHDHGYGNAGATSGHLIPGYEQVLKIGFKGIYEDIEKKYQALKKSEQKGARGAQLRAMMTAAAMPGDLARPVCETLLETGGPGRRCRP